MKRLLLILILCAVATGTKAQFVNNPCDSIQNQHIETIELKLNSFQRVHSTGAKMWFAGLIATGVGIALKSDGVTIAGGISGAVGTFLMITAPDQLKDKPKE